MRAFLLALALLCVPGTAFAQRASSATVDLQRVGAWAQQLTASQQPAIDAYQRCGPLIRQIGELMRSGEPGRAAVAKALLPGMRECVANMRTAITVARDGLAHIGPLPKSIEQGLHIDSAAVLRQAVVSLDGMVASLRVEEEMLTAAAEGNFPLAMQKLKETQSLAGSALEGQLALLQAMRAAVPLETHQAMLDIRIVMTQAMYAIITCDVDADRGELPAKLHQLGGQARAAAARLRANWRREGKDLHDLVRQINDPARTALVVVLDDTFELLAVIGDDTGAMLEALPAGPPHPADTLNVLDQLAAYEVRLIQAIRAMADAVGKVS